MGSHASNYYTIPHDPRFVGIVCVFLVARCVQLSVTPWTVTHQSPLPMGILQARILVGLLRPPPGDLTTQGLNPGFPHCRWILYGLSPRGNLCVKQLVFSDALCKQLTTYFQCFQHQSLLLLIRFLSHICPVMGNRTGGQ